MAETSGNPFIPANSTGKNGNFVSKSPNLDATCEFFHLTHLANASNITINFMEGSEIRSIRRLLGLNQAQFGQLMGVHAITVSKWEGGITSPTDYQVAFLSQYRVAAKDKQVRDELKNVLVAAGVIAAVFLLLGGSKK
jgi:putative transcriptional regulator